MACLACVGLSSLCLVRQLPFVTPRYEATKPWRRSCSVRCLAITAKQRHPANAEGTFYVDHTCIDCDTCRWMAPETFGRTTQAYGGQSYVHQQPEKPEDMDAALQAMISCPTGSIRTTEPLSKTKEVLDTFPILVHSNCLGCFISVTTAPKALVRRAIFWPQDRVGVPSM